MSAPEILNEKPLSMVEVQKEIAQIKKRDKELSFRTQRTEEYLNFFVHKDASKLFDAIQKLSVTRLKDEHISKIVDLMPRTVDDLKIILQGYTITVTKDNMKKIVDEVAKFL